VACAPKEAEENVEKEVLRVGMELKWPPFETADTSGNPEGISVMIAQELGAYLGREVEIVDLPFGSLIPALETNKIDVIIASMSITESRKQSIDFSDPYVYFKILPLVSKSSGLKTLDDVWNTPDLTFVAPKAFVTIELANDNANNPTVVEFDDKATASLELVNGNAEVFLIDAIAAIGIQREYPEVLEVIYEPAIVYNIGMGVRKGEEEFLAQLNEFIAAREELGVNDRIRAEYDETLIDMVGKGLDFYLDED
jgi:polar amino acid transport system substrate-binding protein